MRFAQFERRIFVFYNNFKKICDAKGLKVTPLVEECGGTKGSIGGWKKGVYPNSEMVMKIAIRLNVSTDYLLFGEERSNINITEDELNLINAYQNLSQQGKEYIQHQMTMAKEFYKK